MCACVRTHLIAAQSRLVIINASVLDVGDPEARATAVWAALGHRLAAGSSEQAFVAELVQGGVDDAAIERR
jgi:hypothetical protein